MVDVRLARPFRQADPYVPNSAAQTRPVVAALDRVADTASAVTQMEAERQYNIETSEAGLRWAQLQEDYGLAENQAKEEPAPGAQGHKQAMQALAEAKVSEFLGSIANGRLRDQYAQRTAEWTAARVVEADMFEKRSTAKMVGQNYEIGTQTLENTARTMSEAQFEDVLKDVETLPLPEGIGADVAAAIRRERLSRVLYSRIDSRPNPDARTAMLDSGQFDALLSPEQMERLRNGARIDKNALEVAAAAAARDARVAAKNRLAELQALMDRGEVVSEKDVSSAIAAGRDAGVSNADLIQFHTRFEDSRSGDYFNAVNDPDGSRSARELARIEATPENKRSAWDRRHAEQLARNVEARAEDTASSLKGLRDEDLVERVQSLPPDQRYAVTSAARPQGVVADIAMLPTSTLRSAAIEGRAILKDRPDLLKNRQGENVADARFAGALGGVSRQLGRQYGAKLEVAKALYANWAARTGNSVLVPEAFDRYASVAIGATVRPDGQLQGGIGSVNQHKVILPDEWTATDLTSSIARTDWSDARAVGGAPISKAFIINNMHPVRVGETADLMIYNMADRYGNILAGPDGRTPLPVRVPKKAPPAMLAPPAGKLEVLPIGGQRRAIYVAPPAPNVQGPRSAYEAIDE